MPTDPPERAVIDRSSVQFREFFQHAVERYRSLEKSRSFISLSLMMLESKARVESDALRKPYEEKGSCVLIPQFAMDLVRFVCGCSLRDIDYGS